MDDRVKIKAGRKKNNHIAVSIQGEAGIYTVKRLHGELSKHLKAVQSMEIDLSGVSEMDTAGFQLLVALKREAAGNGKSLSLVGHSAAVLRVLDLYGAIGFFGDRIRVPASQRGNYAFRYGLKTRKRA
ncbi:MAG TPA: STAS domain-containing protein [Spirochaetota bacterium]|nr:STAS domain-containing protein [Spirochaetota bacterium]HNU92299.1 STAS domain-containing protein [Spirochaetota bacterium]HPO44809.1 STAS domain-containing protein [Spirochaetota bacterium]HPV96654.1 STAS domain-containing protein [Spirochaetota bacterium]